MKTAVTTTTIDRTGGVVRDRRGVAIGDLLTVLAILGGVGLSVIVISPRILRAGGTGQFDTELDPRTTPAQFDSITKLEYLCETGSAIVSASAAPDLDTNIQWLVVWTADNRYPDKVDLSEVIFLRHSSTLHTLMVYAYTGTVEDDTALDLDRVREPRYLESLCARSDVSMRIVAGGLEGIDAVVADGEILRPARLDQSSRSARLRLTWLSDSSDEPLVTLLREDLPHGLGSR